MGQRAKVQENKVSRECESSQKRKGHIPSALIGVEIGMKE